MSKSIGESLEQLSALPLLLMIATICLAVTFLTEVTSNMATTTLLMPILAAAAIGADTDPALFMIPAAMSASCAFMLVGMDVYTGSDAEARVMYGIITGMGFIGGGSIIKGNGRVAGTATAAPTTPALAKGVQAEYDSFGSWESELC